MQAQAEQKDDEPFLAPFRASSRKGQIETFVSFYGALEILWAIYEAEKKQYLVEKDVARSHFKAWGIESTGYRIAEARMKHFGKRMDEAHKAWVRMQHLEAERPWNA